ncbi:GPI anchored protein [Diaporthe eres]|nr:GPI anchored protein [Diaporthe eres]
MRPFTIFARLPASLLLLVAAQVGQGHADAQRLPTAIRKMSPDAGEKLLHEYYAFGGEEEVAQVGTQPQAAMLAKGVLDVEEEELLAANSSASVSFRAPFAPHFDSHLAARENEGGASGWHLFQRARDVVARLEKRQFACPTGTSDCSAIGFPNSCCQAGTDCVQITDTGLGPHWMRAERDCYGDRCDADEHPDFVGQRLSDNDHCHRHRHTLCDHDNQHEHQDKLEFNVHERVLHYSHLDFNDLNRDILWSRSTGPPDLDEHFDHTPRLLSHGLLRLFSCLRRRLLPDRPRLPGGIVPIDGIHHHHVWRPDDCCAPDCRSYHHLGGHLRRRLDHVPDGGGPDCRVLPVWVQLRHCELFLTYG